MKTHHLTRREIAMTAMALGVLLVLSGCLFMERNRAPVADFQVMPREGYAPLLVELDASASYDADGDVLRYEWTLGDEATLEGRTVTHQFSMGTHTVALRVFDEKGLSDRMTLDVIAREVPDGYVVRRYTWTYKASAQVWDALLPYDLYQTYRGRLRTPYVDNYDYPAFVLDPLDDPTLEEYATVLWNQSGGDADQFIERTLAFVQGGIAYAEDPPALEWPLYPIETMYDARGDCEDTTILFVSLLRARGVASKMAYVDTDHDRTPDHVLALVPVSTHLAGSLSCSGGEPNLIWFEGALHAIAETALVSGELGLGCDPWGLKPEDIIEWWAF